MWHQRGGLGVVMDGRVSAGVPRGWRWPWPTRSLCGVPWLEQHGLVASRERPGLTVGVKDERMVV